MKTKEEIYLILGFQKKEDFLEQRLQKFARLYGSELLQIFKELLKNGSTDKLRFFNKLKYRQIGNTTDKIIDTILHEYYGNNVIYCTSTIRERDRIQNLWKEYRNKIIEVMGNPPNKTTILFLTEQGLRNYRGYDIRDVLIIEDLHY